MKEFILYTYQFSPLINSQQLDCFVDVQKEKENLMKEKNRIFGSILQNIEFKYRNKIYGHFTCSEKDDIIILRIANEKEVKIERNFRISKEKNEPSCLIIIDNRPNIQRIGIENNIHSFGSTDMIRNILLRGFQLALKSHRLFITMDKEYQPKEFWDICNKYKSKVTRVVFTYQYPNLGRAHQEMVEMLKNSSKSTDSEETQISYENKNGLQLSEDDEVIQGCVKDSSEGGAPIKMRIKGLSKEIKTGKTEKVIRIDEIDIENKNVDKIKTLFRNI